MKQTEEIEIEIVKEKEAKAPSYSTVHAAGADVRAFIQEEQTLLPGQSALIPTGLRVSIPEGYEIQVRPRSGLAFKHQVTVLNTPGTIDADYRGEIKILLINHGKESFIIKPGMRIAQLVATPVVQARFIEAEDLVLSERGEGGFGHTGIY